MVINRGAFLAGRYLEVFEEIVAVKEACGDAHLKVILETGELATYDNVRRASWLAMLAGGDFIKTSTGKVPPAATLPVTLVMLEAVRDFRAATGRQVGVKPAGGIRTTKDAIKYLVLVNETVGDGLARPGLVPVRRLHPAQRPADAAHQAGHRPLRRPRLLHPGLSRCAFEYAPAPESRSIVDIQPSYGLFIDGEFVDGRRRQPSRRSTRPPRRCWPRSPRPAPADVDRAVAAARRGVRRGLGPDARARSGPSTCSGSPGIIQERSRELAVLESLDNGKPIRESRDVDMPLVAAHFFYYAGWADKLAYAGFGADPRPLGRGRAGHPVELPAAHAGLEDRARRWPPATRWCSSRPRPPR